MVEEKKQSSKHRDVRGFLRWLLILISGIAMAFAIIFNFSFQIWAIPTLFSGHGYYYLLIMLYLPMVFLWFPATKGSAREKIPWYDFALAALCFISSLYFCIHSLDILTQGWQVQAPVPAKVFSLILVLLVLESARRTAGLMFFSVCLLFGAFPLFSQHMPAFLLGNSFGFWRTMTFHAMGDASIVGLPMQVVGNILIGFMIFAVALQYTGAGAFFLNLALALFGHVRGGAAKVSIVSSGFMGSLSGSVIANIMTTGSFTIPTMKKTGIPGYYAAAVEACASTGGVLMPPIMGATAFVMAEILGIPYSQVIIAAAIPSILYYTGLFLQIDAYAARTGLKGLPREDCPPLWNVLKIGWLYLVALLLLLYYAVWLWRESQAPWVSMLALFIMAMMRKETRLSPNGFADFLEGSGKFMAELTAILAAVGMIIGALMVTGVAHSFSYEIMSFAGGNVPFLLILGALTSLILGMGMTITACYIFLALVMAPALVELGYYPLAVHLFLVYWGEVSFITPPVALGSFAAASLAEAPFLQTGWHAVRLGLYKYFLPFFFVLNPALVAHGTLSQVLYAFLTCGVGIWLISNAVVGYMTWLGRVDGFVLRSLTFASGFLVAMPERRTDLVGLALGVLVIIVLVLKRRIVVREEAEST
jgi:TRAP transporter 4TM/12TM fusion protein